MDVPALKPAPLAPGRAVKCAGWPSDGAQARQRQKKAGALIERQIELGRTEAGERITLDLVLVPAGEFVMGDAAGSADERPAARVRINRPFWMGKFEISNRQFALFNAEHDNRYFNRAGKDQSDRGVPLNQSAQPVVRVSWEEARSFCGWLSEKTGERIDLPTEAQWEYACRAGAASPMSYGKIDADFSKLANMADANLGRFRGRVGTSTLLLKAGNGENMAEMQRITRDKTVPVDRRYKVREPVVEVVLGEQFIVETINFRTPVVRTPEDANPATYREREETGGGHSQSCENWVFGRQKP